MPLFYYYLLNIFDGGRGGGLLPQRKELGPLLLFSLLWVGFTGKKHRSGGLFVP
jgi:hypothetical protein